MLSYLLLNLSLYCGDSSKKYLVFSFRILLVLLFTIRAECGSMDLCYWLEGQWFYERLEGNLWVGVDSSITGKEQFMSIGRCVTQIKLLSRTEQKSQSSLYLVIATNVWKESINCGLEYQYKILSLRCKRWHILWSKYTLYKAAVQNCRWCWVCRVLHDCVVSCGANGLGLQVKSQEHFFVLFKLDVY